MENTTLLNESQTFQKASRATPLQRFPDVEELTKLVTQSSSVHERHTVTMPFSGEELGSVPVCVEADVQLALQRARAAQPEWARTRLADRTRIFLRFHDLVMKNCDGLLDLLQLEAGKTRLNALDEILDVAINARPGIICVLTNEKGRCPCSPRQSKFIRPWE
jgi:acyl-CoA reductase-like NAD-dependent aldehyde dehydrogenase